MNITFDEDNKQTLLNIEMSRLLFSSVVIKKISLGKSGFLNSIISNIEFKDCFFNDIMQKTIGNPYSFIYSSSSPDYINLINCSFSLLILGRKIFIIFASHLLNNIGNDLVHCEKSFNNILVEKTYLDDFITLGYAFNFISATNIKIINMRCTASNSTTQNRNFIYTSTGGCVRTTNAMIRIFENIEILDSFSDKTTYGIIINDDSQIKNNNFSLSNFSKVNCFKNLF